MKIAILSAGPSLATTWHPILAMNYQCTIAVNNAIKHQRTDILVALDGCMLVRLGEHRPYFTTYTHSDVIRHPPTGWTDIKNALGLRGWSGLTPAPNFSIQAALAVAASASSYRPGTVVDVYGHDMAGPLDVAGETGDQRGEGRWSRERAAWAVSCAWAERLGIIVNHIRESHGQEH